MNTIKRSPDAQNELGILYYGQNKGVHGDIPRLLGNFRNSLLERPLMKWKLPSGRAQAPSKATIVMRQAISGWRRPHLVFFFIFYLCYFR